MPETKQELGGYFMEYPTAEEAKHYMRELGFDERLTLFSQGFHRSLAPVHCYSFEDFVMAIGKREFDNPTGGVRKLDYEQLVAWLENVIGDEELVCVVKRAMKEIPDMGLATDTIRTIVFIRLNQYKELCAENDALD